MGIGLTKASHSHHCPRPECGKAWSHAGYSCAAAVDLECPEHSETKAAT